MDKENLIGKIIEKNRYINRKITNSDYCHCYNSRKCHGVPDYELLCFFCLCPEYETSNVEGGCKINSQLGKWFYHEKLPKGIIWDCSDCKIPHTENYVRKYLNKLSFEELLKASQE